MNRNFPEGNFNGIDRIATRHSLAAGSPNGTPEGRTSLGFLDGHVEVRLYPARTEGRERFTEFGQPHVWHKNGPADVANMSRFIRRLGGQPPW